MDAVVTIKLSVSELDTVREALTERYEQMLGIQKDQHIDASTRSAARVAAVKLNDVLGSLNK